MSNINSSVGSSGSKSKVTILSNDLSTFFPNPYTPGTRVIKVFDGSHLLTPEMAKIALSQNLQEGRFRNRKFSENRQAFKQMCTDILSERFKFTHLGICFQYDNVTKTWACRDGQHRLNACVITNRSIPVMVVFDSDDDAFQVIDRGSKRSLSDDLMTRDDSKVDNNFTRYGTIGRYLVVAGDPTTRAGGKFSQSQLFDFVGRAITSLKWTIEKALPETPKSVRVSIQSAFASAYYHNTKYTQYADKSEYLKKLCEFGESLIRVGNRDKNPDVLPTADDALAGHLLRYAEKLDEKGNARDPVGLAKLYLQAEFAIHTYLTEGGKINKATWMKKCLKFSEGSNDFPSPRYPVPSAVISSMNGIHTK